MSTQDKVNVRLLIVLRDTPSVGCVVAVLYSRLLVLILETLCQLTALTDSTRSLFSGDEEDHVASQAGLRCRLRVALVDGDLAIQAIDADRGEVAHVCLKEAAMLSPQARIIVRASDEFGSGDHRASVVGDVSFGARVVKDDRTWCRELTDLCHERARVCK